MESYNPTIGIEVHVEVKSKSKLFSNSANTYGMATNTAVNVIDLGYPGTLPTINREIIKQGIRAAHVLHCDITRRMHFDRKNYFYPDNPKNYQITQNEGETALHGGVTGLNQKLWDIVELKDGEEPSLTLACFSPDGEEGFPGNLRVQVVYTVTANDGLRIEYFAQSDKKTPINLTNHAYFNLKGDPAQDILDNLLCIHADAYTPIDADSIPTGELAPVQGTPMDFTSPKPIGRDICADFAQLKKPMGYDHNYVLNASKEELPCIAEVQDPQSGRRMRVYTDQPGVQLYTANFLDGSEMGKNGVPLQQHHALCLETQNFPDSVHQPGFPDPFYGPGRDYHYTTIYQFDIG